MDNDYVLEKYNKLYNQYKKMFISMMNNTNLENATLLELSILLKLKYRKKEKAITRAVNLFFQKPSEDSLDELIDLYEYIKE